MKSFHKISATLLLTMIIFLSIAKVPASAAKINVTKQELEYFKPVNDVNTASYHSVKLYLGNSQINEGAYLINETTYIPLRAVSTLAGASVAFDDDTRTAYITKSGLSMSVADGSYIVYANERPLLSTTPATILSDGRMYVPVRSIAKALSLTVEWLPSRIVKLSGTVKPLAHADKFYNQDNLYWLSRIISAESQGEPLLGQIAVGTIVMNRVAHRDYPNTIYSVIFDRKYGVQFSPILDGAKYNTPSYNSTLAAKISLEGYRVDSGVLFFLEPRLSTSSWIPKNREYAFTIGNHDFYR